MLFGRILALCGHTVGVFCSPNRSSHRTLFGESYPCGETRSVYSTALWWLVHRTLFWGVLLLCSDTVGVLCSPLPTAQQDTLWGSLTPMQRYSRCILQPQPTWPLWLWIDPFPSIDIYLSYNLFLRILLRWLTTPSLLVCVITSSNGKAMKSVKKLTCFGSNISSTENHVKMKRDFFQAVDRVSTTVQSHFFDSNKKHPSRLWL